MSECLDMSLMVKYWGGELCFFWKNDPFKYLCLVIFLSKACKIFRFQERSFCVECQSEDCEACESYLTPFPEFSKTICLHKRRYNVDPAKMAHSQSVRNLHIEHGVLETARA